MISGVRFTKGNSAGLPKSRHVPRPRYHDLNSSDGCESCQAVLQYCCGDACQFSKLLFNLKDKSRDFETWRNLRKLAACLGDSIVTRYPHPIIQFSIMVVIRLQG